MWPFSKKNDVPAPLFDAGAAVDVTGSVPGDSGATPESNPVGEDTDLSRRISCPRCSIMMDQIARQGVTIDFCPRCRGMWLDHGELQKITAMKSFSQAEDRFIAGEKVDESVVDPNQAVTKNASAPAKRSPPKRAVAHRGKVKTTKKGKALKKR